jgi:hypothetical protein
MVHAGPPTRTPGALGSALRIVDAGPAPFCRAAAASLSATSALTVAISLAIRPAGSLPAPQRVMITIALAALGLVAALTVASACWPALRRAAVLDRVLGPEGRAAVWLALAVWFPMLLIVATFRALATKPQTIQWLNFGFLDKRWETSAYLLGVLAPMLVLMAANRLLTAGRERPQSWRSWLRGMIPQASAAVEVLPRRRSARAARVAAGVLTAVGLAWYFYGPPWYLVGQYTPIGAQEDVFLSGLQAISNGSVPYIGPASLQYGPGAQLVSYLYMRHVSTFSVVGFRESWAMFQWAGASIFFVAVFLAFGYARGLAVALMSALIYPALQELGFRPGQGFTGFFGWGDVLRYAGAFTLVVLLPAVIRRCPSGWGLAGAAALGLVWGALSYVAQENLIAGAVGAVAVAALLLLSGTSSGRAVSTALLSVLAGFLLVWVPALAFYAAKGLLGRFLSMYFLVPRAVAEGYSNTVWGGQFHKTGGWTAMFYALPFLLGVLALLSVFEFRPLRIAGAWTRDRILLVAILLTTIVLYQGALLRSDASHLIGTLLAVPALVVIVATALPRLLGARGGLTMVLTGAAVVAASLVLLPLRTFEWSAVRTHAEAPYLERQRLAAEPAASVPATVAGQRVGAGLATARTCCEFSVWSMPQFIQLMDRIHAIIGNRTTYVQDVPGGFPGLLYPGLIYFVADLTPAPIPLDPYTLVFNEPQRRAYLAYFGQYVLPRTQALVTSDLSSPEAADFLSRYRHADRTITLSFAGRPYYVVLHNT